MNLKQMAINMVLYTESHDGRMPKDEWMAPIAQAMHETQFTCPHLSSEKKQWGYAMNLAVSGATVDKVNPSQVMFFETDALGKDVIANLAARAPRRHPSSEGEGSNIVRMDSSAKFVLEGDPKGSLPSGP